jgi:hypothetical protein
MRQSLQIDMRVKSENLIRGVDPMALYGMHDAQRKKVTALLTTHIVKPPEVVSGESNQFIVTLCRISAGFLDSEDNLTGAFKHVRDAVGRWLGFKNDSNERLHWRYQQQECVQKSYAIRITIDDLSSGNERDITVGDAPKVLGPPTERCVRLVRKDRKVDAARARAERLAKAQASRANQEALAFRRVFVACPWDLGPGAAADDIVATELHELAPVEEPPEQLQVQVPRVHVDRMLRQFGSAVRGLGPGPGPRMIFERCEHEDPAMGGKCWLYMPVEHDEAPKA